MPRQHHLTQSFLKTLTDSFDFKQIFIYLFPIRERLQSKVKGTLIDNFSFYGHYCNRRKDYSGHAMTVKLSDVYCTAYLLFLTAISL